VTQATSVRSAPDDDAPTLLMLPPGTELAVHSVTVGYAGDDPEATTAWGAVGFVRLEGLEASASEHGHLRPYRALLATPIHEGPGITFPVALDGTAWLYEGDAVQGQPLDGLPWVWLESGVGFVHRLDVIEAENYDPPPVKDDDPPLEEITPDTPLMGPPRATSATLINAITSRGTRQYTDFDVQVIVEHYWGIASAVGVDPLLAVAQMVLETDNLRSWWAARPRRNPAGLGVTGERRTTMPPEPERHEWSQDAHSWVRGLSFPTWQHSVRAHIGRLLAYALRHDQASAAQQQLLDEALALRPLPNDYRGCAPTLRGLNGRWAVPGEDYAERIARIANTIRAVV